MEKETQKKIKWHKLTLVVVMRVRETWTRQQQQQKQKKLSKYKKFKKLSHFETNLIWKIVSGKVKDKA